MYSYIQEEYFGDDFGYGYVILDTQGCKIATVYDEWDAKNLIVALNRKEMEEE